MQVIYIDETVICLEGFIKKVVNSLDSPPYFGHNLDALHDLLVGEIDGAIYIIWSNWQTVRRSLGHSIFKRIVLFFKACQQEKRDLFMSFVINDDDKKENICQFEVRSLDDCISKTTGYFELNKHKKNGSYTLSLIGLDGNVMMYSHDFSLKSDVEQRHNDVRFSLDNYDSFVIKSLSSSQFFFELIGDSKNYLASSVTCRSVEEVKKLIGVCMSNMNAPVIDLCS
jgi:RNAse (barnase) inhibitor barstar